ncbi:MAG: YjjI family glycine radical enzyme [Trueperaceae bacterium]|nr:YjjI family glycine radical enzyme [Trueperaceae bacterium]
MALPEPREATLANDAAVARGPVDEGARAAIRRVIEDPTLAYRQRVQQLAAQAEGLLEMPPVGDACRAAQEQRIVCDMYEGAAPYRPRYLLPDYAKALREGSAYLELPPPNDLNEALWFLASMYAHVPSITGYPVYLGDLDTVLAPYVEGMSTEQIVPVLRPFWRAIDRTVPDAFAHTDLGPHDTPFVRAVLHLERELTQVVPNVTLKVQPGVTPDSLLLDAVRTVFACAKPHFVNHEMMVRDHGEGYAAVSCYNSLKIGGGSHTLVRLNLREAVARHRGSTESFFAETLPRYVELTSELIEARIRYLVERARFFEHDWLVQEGLVDLDRFSAMFGVFGLAEAVDQLMERDGHAGRYGHDPAANELSYRITRTVAAQVAGREQPYCDGFAGRAMMHAQSGIDSDVGVTAGTRIPIGTEPDLFQHLTAVAPHHELFASGVSDIVHFDDTAKRNPEAVVDVIRGAFAQGMREFTFNLDSNEFIRITGYLVRKSDLERIEAGARHGSTFLGAGNEAEAHCSRRASKRVVAAERLAGS